RHSSSSLKDVYEKLTAISGIIAGRNTNLNEQRTSPDGKELEGKYDESYCTVSFSNEWSSSDARDLESSLSEAIESIGPALPQIKSSGSRAEFFIGLAVESNSGLTLDTNLLQKLADEKIELSFDLYPPDKA